MRFIGKAIEEHKTCEGIAFEEWERSPSLAAVLIRSLRYPLRPLRVIDLLSLFLPSICIKAES